MAAVKDYVDDFIKKQDENILQTLIYAGIEFVNKAREKTPSMGGFRDRTGNLRSSIGFVVLKDGQSVYENFQGADGGTTDGGEGVSAARRHADEFGQQYPDGYVLIGVAGMAYAAAVEARGYDVITGSEPLPEDLIRFLRAINP